MVVCIEVCILLKIDLLHQLQSSDVTDLIIEKGSINTGMLQEISEDKIIEAVGNLIQITGQTSASGSVNNNEGIRLTSTLSDKVDSNRVMMGIPEMTAYEDSVASNTVIPYGSNTIGGNYKLHQAADYRSNLNASTPGKGHTWIYYIHNESGGASTIYFYVVWRYLGRETAG